MENEVSHDVLERCGRTPTSDPTPTFSSININSTSTLSPPQHPAIHLTRLTMAPPKDMLKAKAANALSKNQSAIGDPVSIKAETTPSEHDLPRSDIKDSQRKGDGKSLKQIAKSSNPSMLGDPVSLKAETSNNEPTDQDRGALRDGKKKDSKL
jgi:hypothetical protein